MRMYIPLAATQHHGNDHVRVKYVHPRLSNNRAGSDWMKPDINESSCCKKPGELDGGCGCTVTGPLPSLYKCRFVPDRNMQILCSLVVVCVYFCQTFMSRCAPNRVTELAIAGCSSSFCLKHLDHCSDMGWGSCSLRFGV